MIRSQLKEMANTSFDLHVREPINKNTTGIQLNAKKPLSMISVVTTPSVMAEPSQRNPEPSSLISRSLIESSGSTLKKRTSILRRALDLSLNSPPASPKRKSVQIWEAVVKGDIKAINTLLSQGISVNQRDPVTDHTPLLATVADLENPTQVPNTNVMELLINRGAEINAFDQKTKQTILHHLCARPNPSPAVLRFLLERGANPNAVSSARQTPLHYLAEKAKTSPLEQMRLLLDFGAEPDAKGPVMWTPLHLLCSSEKPFLDSIMLLLTRDVDVNIRDSNHWTALHFVAHYNQEPIQALKILVDAGADVNALTKRHETVVHVLLKSKSIDRLSTIDLDPTASDAQAANAAANAVVKGASGASNTGSIASGILGPFGGNRRKSMAPPANPYTGAGLARISTVVERDEADVAPDGPLDDPMAFVNDVVLPPMEEAKEESLKKLAELIRWLIVDRGVSLEQNMAHEDQYPPSHPKNQHILFRAIRLGMRPIVAVLLETSLAMSETPVLDDALQLCEEMLSSLNAGMMQAQLQSSASSDSGTVRSSMDSMAGYHRRNSSVSSASSVMTGVSGGLSNASHVTAATSLASGTGSIVTPRSLAVSAAAITRVQEIEVLLKVWRFGDQRQQLQEAVMARLSRLNRRRSGKFSRDDDSTTAGDGAMDNMDIPQPHSHEPQHEHYQQRAHYHDYDEASQPNDSKSTLCQAVHLSEGADGNSDVQSYAMNIKTATMPSGSEQSLLNDALRPVDLSHTTLPTSPSQRSIEKAIAQKFATLGMPRRLTWRARMDRFMLNEGPRALFLCFWCLLQCLIFYLSFEIYNRSIHFSQARATLGVTLGIARGSAAVINFDCGLILFSVCRNLISVLRSTFLNDIVPFDKNILFHKTVAWSIVVFSVIHCLGHYVNYYRLETHYQQQHQQQQQQHETTSVGAIGSKEHRTAQSMAFLTGPGATGHGLVLILFLMVTSSVDSPPYCRSSPGSYKFILGSSLVYILERVVREIRARSLTSISKIVLHPSKVVEVQIKRDHSEHDAQGQGQGRGQIDPYFRAKAGQYVFLNCPDISMWEWHPFTITSAPEEDYVSVHIRIVGDWTTAFARRLGCVFDDEQQFWIEELMDRNHTHGDRDSGSGYLEGGYDRMGQTGEAYGASHGSPSSPFGSEATSTSMAGGTKARFRASAASTAASILQRSTEAITLPRVLIDGPYGSPSEDAFNYEIAVLVGAGIGVTPFASVLKHIWYSVMQPTKIITLRKVYFFWVCRDRDAFEWFQDLLIALEEQNLSDFLEIRSYLTGELGTEELNTVLMEARASAAMAAARNLRRQSRKEKQHHRKIPDHDGNEDDDEEENGHDQEDEGSEQDTNPSTETLSDMRDRDAITGLRSPTYYGRPNFDKIFGELAQAHPREHGQKTFDHFAPNQSINVY
ncbi:hypothetical protein BGX31_003457 [Mortierella sp. GBA43]|nr:hypothetical protein BGX31_003457 [Mortierella sp. GBA43]